MRNRILHHTSRRGRQRRRRSNCKVEVVFILWCKLPNCGKTSSLDKRFVMLSDIIRTLFLKEPPKKALLTWISSLYCRSWNSHFVLTQNSRVIYPTYLRRLRGKIPAFSTMLYVVFQGFYMKLFVFGFSCIVRCRYSTESISTSKLN